MDIRGKGVSFVGILHALRERHGDEIVDAVLNAMRGESGRLARDVGFLAGSWYCVSHYRELHRAIGEVTGGGAQQAHELGREAGLKDFQGVYRVFVRVVSPTMLMNVAPRLVQRYWEGTHIDMHELRHGFARATYRGFEGFDERVWADVLGGTKALLIACGGEAVRHHITRGGKDDAETDVEFHWISP